MDEKHFSKSESSLLPFVLTSLLSRPRENLQLTDALNNKANAVLKFVQVLLNNLDADSTKSITHQLTSNNFDALIQSGTVLYELLGTKQFNCLTQTIQYKGYKIDISMPSQTLTELYSHIANQHCADKSHEAYEHSQNSTSNHNLMLTIGPEGNWVLLNNKHLDLRRRGPMRRILLKLVEYRNAEQAVTAFTLIRAG